MNTNLKNTTTKEPYVDSAPVNPVITAYIERLYNKLASLDFEVSEVYSLSQRLQYDYVTSHSLEVEPTPEEPRCLIENLDLLECKVSDMLHRLTQTNNKLRGLI